MRRRVILSTAVLSSIAALALASAACDTRSAAAKACNAGPWGDDYVVSECETRYCSEHGGADGCSFAAPSSGTTWQPGAPPPGAHTPEAMPAACSADCECAVWDPEYRCLAGKCASVWACAVDEDCIGGAICAIGTCALRCGSSADCPKTYACENNGVARASVCERPACVVARDCDEASVCAFGVGCVPRLADGGACPPGFHSASWIGDAFNASGGCLPDESFRRGARPWPASCAAGADGGDASADAGDASAD